MPNAAHGMKRSYLLVSPVSITTNLSYFPSVYHVPSPDLACDVSSVTTHSSTSQWAEIDDVLTWRFGFIIDRLPRKRGEMKRRFAPLSVSKSWVELVQKRRRTEEFAGHTFAQERRKDIKKQGAVIWKLMNCLITFASSYSGACRY